ncbi:unnamed protein product [Rodentolepis nana]|uniref:LAM_G_DOMAIN domain-containing protein n=1 Tax=Rodentolepis nana TaxID=102285 RepID=A0A0R3TRI5_RODNA|nr:unnamed protein product [Rodentolepis nana]
MNFEYYNFKQLRRGKFTVDLVISHLKNSNKLCDRAALWLFHGGRFDIIVAQKTGDAVTILQAPLQDGLGELVFQDGVVRNNRELRFNLILEGKDKNVNLESSERLLTGMLRCIPSCLIPVYFYNDLSLPEEFDGMIAISTKCLRHSFLASSILAGSCLDGQLFIAYCDQSLPGPGKCFLTFDRNPKIWKYLGPAITHIKAYLRANRTLIGYSSSSRSYLISENYGQSWVLIHHFVFRKMLATPDVTLDTTLMVDDANFNQVIDYSIRNWRCKLLLKIPSSTISAFK